MSYPRYLMNVNGKEEWLSLRQAGAAYDNGHMPVSIGLWVTEAEGSPPRRMTDDDRRAISDAADEHSDSK